MKERLQRIKEFVDKYGKVSFHELEIAFSDVSVTHDDAGCPELLLAGGAKAALRELAGTNARTLLSISDQGDYSAAVVIIEKQD